MDIMYRLIVLKILTPSFTKGGHISGIISGYVQWYGYYNKVLLSDATYRTLDQHQYITQHIIILHPTSYVPPTIHPIHRINPGMFGEYIRTNVNTFGSRIVSLFNDSTPPTPPPVASSSSSMQEIQEQETESLLV